MKNNSFEEIWNKLKSFKRVVMSLHAKPDGDSLGSCTALKYVLERDLKCRIKLVSYDTLSEDLNQFPFAKEVEFGTDISDLDPNKFDGVIFLDSSLENQSGKLKKEFKIPKIFTINLDHHNTNTFYGNMNYVDKESPSACSVLVNFFKDRKINFDKELSTRLLLGICTDTIFFKTQSSDKALKDAGFLVEHEAEYFNKIVSPLELNIPLKYKRYIGVLFNNFKLVPEQKFGYSIITQKEVKDLGLNETEIRGGANELQYIKECDFIFTLTELENEIKGSFRSKKEIDVSLFAKELGGGGHKLAAGFVLPKMSLNLAEEKVLEAVKKVGIQKI